MNKNTSVAMRGAGIGLAWVLAGCAGAQTPPAAAPERAVVRQVPQADTTGSAPISAPREAGAQPIATAAQAGPGPARTSGAPTAQTPAASALAPNSVVAELNSLLQAKVLNELRTTYNGQYGASLLFKADTLTYYVALFQQRQFWRAIKTTDYAQAEQIYRSFNRQTEQLSAVDIERVRLEAEQVHIQKEIGAESSRLEALRGDVVFQQQREREVQAVQEEVRQEASTLAAQQQASRDVLKALQRSIQVLETQQESLIEGENAPLSAPASRPGRSR